MTLLAVENRVEEGKHNQGVAVCTTCGVETQNVLVQSRRMSLRGETGPFTESHPQ